MQPRNRIHLCLLIAAGLLHLPVAGPSICARDEETVRAGAHGEELRFWLENMLWGHDFTIEEMAAATELSPEKVKAHLKEFGIRRGNRPSRAGSATLEVLPYPGGRHPRIGFLDGAIDPHRDTKASVFLPWRRAGYVVIDLPEALWSNLGLTYLAHTHIPTIWDKKKVRLERIDWTRKAGGVLESRRVLPNGIEFSTRILPRKDAVDMEMRLKNGTDRKLSGLRAQICVLLKGAPEFNQQTNDNKIFLGRAAAARSRDGRRWIVAVWERAKPWANPPCPCMHSDPVFPDLDSGKEAVVRGRLFFYEGADLEAEIERRRKAGTLDWKPKAGG